MEMNKVAEVNKNAFVSSLDSPQQVKVKKRQKPVKSYIPILAFFLLWETFSRVNITLELMNPKFLPPPTMVLVRAWEMIQTGILLESLLSSTLRVLIGFLIGGVLGVAMALLIGKSKRVDDWITPVLNMLGPIPALAILPLFIIWFGIGEVPKITLIAWTVFFPVLTNTVDGIKSVNSTLIRSALSLGANEKQIYRKVVLPSVLPNILAGCQISLGLAFGALVVSEMMGATSGLGYIIVDARNYFKLSDMYVSIIAIGIEYSLFSVMLKIVDKKMLTWRRGGFSQAVEK
ncbi:ABC transporter permease [Robertmurraya sp. P23]|uniref:ABC transporter permease n=1 Tax=Robertmurraya sp. P23 TaxID=3436931 RepID=UPI003D96D1F1